MLSAEKAAATAPSNKKVATFCDVVLLQLWQMKTRLGESAVSEKIASVPSGEVVSTLPAALETLVTLVPLRTIAP